MNQKRNGTGTKNMMSKKMSHRNQGAEGDGIIYFSNVPHHLPRKAGTPDADEKGAV